MKKTKKAEGSAATRNLPNENSEPSEAEIARLAYEIWEMEGRPEGRDLDHWMMARKQLLGVGDPKAETDSKASGS